LADWTISSILGWSETYFLSKSIDSPRLAAEILLSFTLGIKRIDLYLQHDRPLNKDELKSYKKLIKRRVNREPVAYIIGKKGFYNSEFSIPPNVLIPRPDTETIVESALIFMASANHEEAVPKNVLELGTGSGAIIISLADMYPEHTYFATDLSDDAIKAIKINSDQILENIKINILKTSWFDAVKAHPFFDIIISNPPYIKTLDIQALDKEIKDYEPVLALDGGKDGLESLNKIILNVSDYLVSGGTLLLEMGCDQKQDIINLVNQCPDLECPEFKKDLAGHWRVAIIKKRLSRS